MKTNTATNAKATYTSSIYAYMQSGAISNLTTAAQSLREWVEAVRGQGTFRFTDKQIMTCIDLAIARGAETPGAVKKETENFLFA